MSEIVGARYEVRGILGYASGILGYASGILGYAQGIPEYGCEFMGKKGPMGLMGKKSPKYGEKVTTPLRDWDFSRKPRTKYL